MGWDFCEVTEQKARKNYHCDASEYIEDSGYSKEDYSEDDYKIIKDAKSEGNKILKGTEYIKCTGKWDGEFSTFRARKDLNYICKEYEFYPDE